MTRNQAGVTANLPGVSSSRFLIPASTFFAQGVRIIGCPPLSCCTEDIRWIYDLQVAAFSFLQELATKKVISLDSPHGKSRSTSNSAAVCFTTDTTDFKEDHVFLDKDAAMSWSNFSDSTGGQLEAGGPAGAQVLQELVSPYLPGPGVMT